MSDKVSKGPRKPKNPEIVTIGLMPYTSSAFAPPTTKTFTDFLNQVDYSFLDSLLVDPQATCDGNDHEPRQIFSGHYVPVTPKALPSPEYITHSKNFFEEIGLSNELAFDERFRRLFSGDITVVKKPMRPFGWATGYALSIYGTEYIHQCPFSTGNGYGDGRAISVFEGILNGRRWEMQLKGAGPTPYCRGADGRAVLRSSVREFLAQEFMNSLGVPTSRSLTLYVSRSEKVNRPWYSNDSRSIDPDLIKEDPTAIATRVAPSFLRVGQLELFARRTRSSENNGAMNELYMIVEHLIKRNYQQVIDPKLPFTNQVIELAYKFRTRLTSLVANWMRVGFCQGNFNSDNCAAGGFTLDYGPFGFCELFDPRFQPWTGGGRHFSFFNQPAAAEANYKTFCSAIRPLLKDNNEAMTILDDIQDGFSGVMNKEIEEMWSKKLGIINYDEILVNELLELLVLSKVDYTIFFRKLSGIPEGLIALKDSFYMAPSEHLEEKWDRWLEKWHYRIKSGDPKETSKAMKLTNPKYTWREWLVAPAYKNAERGDYSLIKELQNMLSNPYEEQSSEVEMKYDLIKPIKFFNAGGISHYSCSS
tara:strand:- start:260 stop:2026 length:1767 start_codon:yes stop_codon:yes gene_type:complete